MCLHAGEPSVQEASFPAFSPLPNRGRPTDSVSGHPPSIGRAKNAKFVRFAEEKADPNPCDQHGLCDPNPCTLRNLPRPAAALTVEGPLLGDSLSDALLYLCDVSARPKGILSASTAASKKLARMAGKLVAFGDPELQVACRDVHATLLDACRLRRPLSPALTRVCPHQLPVPAGGPRICPNQWVQGYVMGRPVSSSSTDYRPQQGVFSAGELDTTAANLLRQYKRVLPAPAPGPPEECGLKRRYSAFDIVRQLIRPQAVGPTVGC